jgi:hypothetical protein
MPGEARRKKTVAMTTLEQIFQAIQRLPIPDRLRLVEQVVHELADVSSARAGTQPEPPASLIGLFADDPDAVDEMMKTVTENRRASRLRALEGEHEKSSP